MSDSDMFYCSFVSIHYIICECGETFPSEEDLKIHLDREHSTKKEKTEYRCGICDTPFDNEHDCLEHYENAHIGIQTEHDYVEVYSQEDDSQDVKDEDLQNVIIQQEEVDTLPENSLNISEDVTSISEDAIELPKKVINIHYENLEEDVEYEVPITEFPMPVALLEVMKRKQDKRSKPYYNKKNVVCEVCGKKYASNAALRYHQRVHTGEKPYMCTECPKSFTMPLFLQIHLRTHTGERPYSCPHCPKAFSNKAALLRHDRVHTGIKPYECPQCGKFFTQSNSMKLHVNTVHLKMPAPYKSKSRRNKQREKEMKREVILRVLDNGQEADESINQESDIYVKPEIIYKQEIQDVGQEMITYEVVYE